MNRTTTTHPKLHLSAATLKWIALLSMAIDHFGVAIMERLLRKSVWDLSMGREEFYRLYLVFRGIGRLGFPLFCFLLVEGFRHTKNRLHYALRLLAFCFLSEYPFDLALFDSPYYGEYQNVFWTLFIGFITLWAIHALTNQLKNKPLIILLSALLTTLSCYLAEVLHTDYGAYGVLTIVVIYVLSNRQSSHVLSLAGGILVLLFCSTLEVFAFFALLPIAGYDGTRGKQSKYFFYLFYPVHLLFYYVIYALFFQ